MGRNSPNTNKFSRNRNEAAGSEAQAESPATTEDVMTENTNEGTEAFIETIATDGQVASQANIAVPPAPPGGSTGGGGAGRIMIKNPVDGKQVNRTDYMRALAAAGWSRPQIHKHLVEITGDEKLRYQTVFQAVKGLYPTRTRETGTHEAPSAPGGEAVNVEEVTPQV